MYLQMKHVSKIIKGNVILDDINLEFDRGNIYGIRGKNGSGKTMLMKAMCGLIRPTSGKVIVKGSQLGLERDFPESVGVLIETPGFLNGYAAFDNLKLLAMIQNKISDEKIAEVLEKTGLGDVGKKKYKNYSLGMKQKLGIAAAIMEDPELILLDEPTNALDQKSVEDLRQILCEKKEAGALIVVASHDKQELDFLSDKIYVMENGKLKEADTDEKGRLCDEK